MNKEKFIDILVGTEKVTNGDLSALEHITGRYPFFQSGHTVLAKVSKDLKSKTSSKKLATAAIYATNRNLFKKYMSGEIKITKQSLETAKQNPSTTNFNTQTTNIISELANDDKQNELINELYKNLDQWKSSRDQYLKYDQEHPEEIVIENYQKSEQEEEKDKNNVKELKSQIAEEVAAEDDKFETVSKEEDKAEAALLDEIKIQVAKEALREEVEELEKELKTKKESSQSSETGQATHELLEEVNETNIDENPVVGSVYNFNSPIPEPEELPEIPEDELLGHNQEEFTVTETEDINTKKTELKEEEPSESATLETDKHTVDEALTKITQKEEVKEHSDAPIIEALDESNEELLSSAELSAIVDQISNKVEQTDSDEDIIIEDISEGGAIDLESQIESMSISVDIEEEPKQTEATSSQELPESNQTAETEKLVEETDDDDDSLLSINVNLDDVKKLDPEEVFEADFSEEDIDFGSGTSTEVAKEQPTQEKTKTTSVSKAESLESLPREELESFEIEPILEDDVVSEVQKTSDNTKSEKALGDINKEKGDLRLVPGASKGEKKFRLSVMKRPHNFTRPKKVLNARETRAALNKELLEAGKKQAESKNIEESNSPNPKKTTPAKEKVVNPKKVEGKPKETETKAKKKAGSKKKESTAKQAKKTTAKTKPKPNLADDELKGKDDKSIKKKTAVSKDSNNQIDHNSIIDSFLETNPSIKANKGASSIVENTIDLSSESSAFPRELITENLATILKNQGKIERAIEIYKKLILNNPKKKAYFASQIENLKKS